MKRFNGQTLINVYAGVLSLVVAGTVITGFGSNGSGPSFDTITVQRINVVEPDGTLRMVLSNNNRIPNIIVKGHEYPDYTGRKATTSAGVLFYDAEATESGGLTFGGLKNAQGAISRFGHLSFDRYDQDQMFSIDAKDDGTNYVAGVRTEDRPSWPIQEYFQLRDSIQNETPAQQQAAINQFTQAHPFGGTTRALFASETYPEAPANTQSLVSVADAQGNVRTHLGVDTNGIPSLQFLDAAGNVTNTYPPN